MYLLNHKNIIGLYSHFETDLAVYLVLEYVSGGQVFSVLQKKRRFTEKKSAMYIYQMIQTLKYCHT